MKATNQKHGKSESEEYRIWAYIKRTAKAKGKFFDEWEEFEDFSNDMGKRPSKDHHITLIDNDGDYNKENVCWMTPEEKKALLIGMTGTYGKYESEEYRIWAYVKRTAKAKGKSFVKWSEFQNFFNDMGERPSKDHHITLIDDDGDYNKDNVRWMTNEEKPSVGNKKHGKYDSEEYRIWAYVKRIAKAKGKPFDEWEEFEDFFNDMGKRPTDHHHIMLRDTDGRYNKENARWMTREEKVRFRVDNAMHTYLGKEQKIYKWIEESNVTYGRFHNRIRDGWGIQDALTLGV